LLVNLVNLQQSFFRRQSVDSLILRTLLKSLYPLETFTELMLAVRRVAVWSLTRLASLNTAQAPSAVAQLNRSIVTVASHLNLRSKALPQCPSICGNVLTRLNPCHPMSSLIKKRRAKMNKHKLRKRRKALRMNTKQSRA
jgi:hypothetical protein